jgi:hypothetical protein
MGEQGKKAGIEQKLTKGTKIWATDGTDFTDRKDIF